MKIGTRFLQRIASQTSFIYCIGCIVPASVTRKVGCRWLKGPEVLYVHPNFYFSSDRASSLQSGAGIQMVDGGALINRLSCYTTWESRRVATVWSVFRDWGCSRRWSPGRFAVFRCNKKAMKLHKLQWNVHCTSDLAGNKPLICGFDILMW